MITTKAFIGREVEGPERGELTLFVPRSAGCIRYLLREECPGIRRVYYGAGEDFGISGMQSYEANDLANCGHTILVEVDWHALVRDIIAINHVACRVVFVGTQKPVSLKSINHDVLQWVQFNDDQLCVTSNSIHDPMYKGDVHAV